MILELSNDDYKKLVSIADQLGMPVKRLIRLELKKFIQQQEQQTAPDKKEHNNAISRNATEG